MGVENELVTIVDRENNEIGPLPRGEMRAGRLIHRASYILVFNSQGELYVQKRTLTKDVFPGYHDVVAGGVVAAGETYEECAERELEEELGISNVPLTPLFHFYYEDEHIRLWGAAFSCVYDGEMILQEEEVESGAFMKVEELMNLPETEPFCPDSLYVLRRYVADNMSD
jgi:8-oxo-dGTP pyrophosphatase MutT (NUDIX family)